MQAQVSLLADPTGRSLPLSRENGGTVIGGPVQTSDAAFTVVVPEVNG